MLKAVIFDLDGVLTNTSHFHFLAWRLTLRKYLKIEIHSKFEEVIRGLSRSESLIQVLKQLNIEISHQLFKKMIREKNMIYRMLLDRNMHKCVYPEVYYLLEDLKNHDIKMAVASSSKNAYYILQQTNLLEYFQVVVNPEEILHGKPNPEIYLKAMEYLNVSADKCIGIEDSNCGIQAINNAGCISIFVGTSDNTEATKNIKNLIELNYDSLLFEWKQFHVNKRCEK